MKNKCLKILLCAGLLLACAAVGFAQKPKRPPRAMIVSGDFETRPANGSGNKNRANKNKRWRKRCSWKAARRNGRTVKIRRCRTVRY